MAHLGNRNTLEGYSITRPPLFDEISFDFWKIRMMTFLQAIDFRIWQLVETGYSPPSQVIIFQQSALTDLKPSQRHPATPPVECLIRCHVNTRLEAVVVGKLYQRNMIDPTLQVKQTMSISNF